MARKITERERLLTYALKATDEQLKEAIETLRVVLNSRTPKERKQKAAKPENPNHARVMPISEAKAAG